MGEDEIERTGPAARGTDGWATAAVVGLAVVGAVAVGELLSVAPVVPRILAAAVAVVSIASIVVLVRRGGVAVVADGHRLWVAAMAVVVLAAVVAAWPPLGGALVLSVAGALVSLGVFLVAVTLAVRGPHRMESVAVAVLVLLIAVVMARPDNPTRDARLHLLASRYRSAGHALLTDPPDDPAPYESPAIGRRRHGEAPEAVVFVWVNGLLGNGWGVVYIPSGQDPSGLQFDSWAATTCSLEEGRDLWWCGLT